MFVPIRLRAVVFVLSSWPLWAACDSGYEKVGEPEPEPEPESEPEPVPEPEVDAASPGFVAPESSFQPADTAARLSELDAEELEALCRDQQRRIDETVEHFSEEEHLCPLIAVMTTIEDALSTTAFQNGCAAALDECVADGPEQDLGTYVSEAVTTLACERWSTAACDPDVDGTLACFDDVVENLVDRLGGLGSCESSRSDVISTSARVAELEDAPSPFVLSNRCGAVECLFGAGSPSAAGADAGTP